MSSIKLQMKQSIMTILLMVISTNPYQSQRPTPRLIASMDNNKGASDNIKNKKIQSNTIESVMSLKVDDSKKKPNNFKFKLHYGNGNINSEDLHKYIHNLIKEKLDRVSERLLD